MKILTKSELCGDAKREKTTFVAGCTYKYVGPGAGTTLKHLRICVWGQDGSLQLNRALDGDFIGRVSELLASSYAPADATLVLSDE